MFFRVEIGERLINSLRAIDLRPLEMSTTQVVSRNRMRMGYSSGIVVGILLPLALLLFGVTSPLRSLSLIFLFCGVWTIIFGFYYQREKSYWIGWGAGIAVLSSIAIVPLRYTIGLVLIVIVILVLATAFGRRSKSTPVQNKSI